MKFHRARNIADEPVFLVPAEESTPTMTQHICSSCGVTSASKICKGCFRVYYCNTECRLTDWSRHIFLCNPRREVTSADYLALDVREHRPPTHKQTCLDWGFEKAQVTISMEARDRLLALYTELIEALGVKPAQLHKWRTEGRLFLEIKALYDALPVDAPTHRSESYRWVLEHRDVIETPSISSEERIAYLDRGYRPVWIRLGRSPSTPLDKIINGVEDLPTTMRSCFYLYRYALGNNYPAPSDNIYLQFGFGVCRDGHQEYGALCETYRNLARVTPLDEFYAAYSTGKLFDLFGHKDVVVRLRPSRAEPLRDILECMPHTEKLKTVWHLEQCLAGIWNATTVGKTIHYMDLPKTAGMDYGFGNCEDNEEHQRKLGKLYRVFFADINADPLKLHKAFMENRLFAFLADDMRMDLQVGPEGWDRALFKRLLTRRRSVARKR